MPLPAQPAPLTPLTYIKVGTKRTEYGVEPDCDLSLFQGAQFTYSDDKSVCVIGVTIASASQLTELSKLGTATKLEFESKASVFTKESSKLAAPIVEAKK